jgi:outer membrane lipase/esterase
LQLLNLVVSLGARNNPREEGKMKDKTRLRNMAVACLTILVLGVPGLSHADDDSDISRIFIFGDSLSDTGNFTSLFGNFPEPPFYMMNRVSNGPVGVEILAERLGLTADASLHFLGASVGSNYSVAGARAINTQPIDLNSQVMFFLANHNSAAPSDALYVIFIGGNDLRDARGVVDPSVGLVVPSRTEAKVIVRDAASGVRNTIEALAQVGARKFLLVNFPNIGAIPETRLLADAFGNPKLIKDAHKVSKQYRKSLHKIAKQLEDESEIEIVEFDLFKFFKKLLRKANHLGFTNTTEACFSSITFSFHPDCNFGANFDQFIFFDEIHPTARVHALVGEALFEALEDDHHHGKGRHHDKGRHHHDHDDD